MAYFRPMRKPLPERPQSSFVPLLAAVPRRVAIAQLNRRSRLGDLVICLQAHQDKLYHLGLSSGISRSTLADTD